MSIPCAATMSQELCFWVPFTDKETETGRWLLRYPVDLDIGGATEFIRVCSLKKLLNSLLMRCESMIHGFIHFTNEKPSLCAREGPAANMEEKIKNPRAV